MKYITTERLPIKMWLNEIEDGALEQTKHLANLPFAFKHIAIMPDAHQGYGMPIGGVLATENVIIPNAVGVDIGCGMCAVKSSLTEMDVETLKKIFGGSAENKGGIRSIIPIGFGHQSKKQDINLMPKIIGNYNIVEQQYQSALEQIGTLGGGNHFIEIQKGDDGHIWIMIHSGSRNFGLKVADYYNKLAVQLNEKWHSVVPKNWELAYFPIDSDEGQSYLTEMRYCVEFALANRKLMMDRIMEVFRVETNATFDEMINIAHNYAAIENHFGQNVWVHRKGAILMRGGMIGIIPSSQGSPSYIVKGLGNPESFMSSSHGAGRKMSRTRAIKELSLGDEQRKMDELGILHSIRSKKDLDEASGAYKDIDDVMNNQSDLVIPIIKLNPLGVIKG
jgi:tRNA-splicing ligase RtcB